MKIIQYALSTEKSIRLMESENKLIFRVDKKATKKMIKDEIEQTFQAKVETVNTEINNKGEKRAFVKFANESPAIDVATKLGLM